MPVQRRPTISILVIWLSYSLPNGLTPKSPYYNQKRQPIGRLLYCLTHINFAYNHYFVSSSIINCSLIATVLKPASTNIISPVIPDAHGDSKNSAALPTSVWVILRCNGAIFSLISSILRNDLIPLAARVRIGPAEIALTRIPSPPIEVAR